MSPRHVQVSRVPGGAGRSSNCAAARRYWASLVAERLMRPMLALRPAKLSAPMPDRKAVVPRRSALTAQRVPEREAAGRDRSGNGLLRAQRDQRAAGIAHLDQA